MDFLFSTFREYSACITWPLCVGLFVILYTAFCNLWSYRNLPPHPIILPIVGNAFFLKGKRMVDAVRDIKDASGNPARMVAMHFIGSIFILLNDIGSVRKLFLGEAELTSDRPHDFMTLTLGMPRFGIINSPAPTWIQTRRVALQILRDLGFGKSVLQSSLEEQCDYLRSFLHSQISHREGVRINKLLSRCSSDIMSMMLFGHKPAMEGRAEVKYVEMIEKFIQGGSKWTIFFPFLRHFSWIPGMPSYERNILRLTILGFLGDQINEHRRNFNPSNGPTDFIDHFLMLEWKEKGKTASDDVFNDANLAHVLQDLFIAGTDTTSVTLTWAIALLCLKPNVQEKVYQELRQVLGDAEYPNMSQLNDCPYTRAVMSEVLRFGITAPGSLAHTVNKDLQFEGYLIPRNAVIVANIFYFSRDPKVWKFPDEFYPEHFYNAETDTFMPNENLLSFSIGRRACLGEALARQEFFMFLASMLLKFRFEFHSSSVGAEAHIIAGRTLGIVRSPNDFLVNAFPRD